MSNGLTWHLAGSLALIVACLAPIDAGLEVRDLGKLEKPVLHADDRDGTGEKWASIQDLLGEQAGRVVVKQPACNLGGNTSVRNRLPLVWKESKGYFRRARDLGQVSTPRLRRPRR